MKMKFKQNILSSLIILLLLGNASLFGVAFLTHRNIDCVSSAKLSSPSSPRSFGTLSINPLSISKSNFRSTARHEALKLSSSSAEELNDNASWKRRLEVGAYFAGMYAVNVAYNVYNKRVLNVYPYPWFIGTLQMFLGSLYFVPLWITGLRKSPKLNFENLMNLMPAALAYIMSHTCTTIALGAGAVSFAHIIKAGEPIFTAGVSAALLGQFFPWQVYATLVPVVGGVGLACLKELSFSWVAFSNALLANLGGALRGVFSKKLMGKPVGENMDSRNLNAVLLLMMSFLLIPAIVAIEGAQLAPGWTAALATGYGKRKLLSEIIISGILFYFYQEISFMALDNVHPITHALGNTFKRAVLIIASVVFFGTKITPLGGLGSAIALVGVFLYSVAKDHYGSKK
mmetsp:Transcript_27522/g.36076  ORF Transcript_27522/g.36076 Transcript_27522/m.36076 type:complete len:400 (+) Transcript_27522:83-1282(+)